MDDRGDRGARDPSEGEWRGRKRRDDTPSFIRNVQARAEMLNPQRTGEAIPVLTMPKSIRIWRRVRWPLFVFLVVALLTAVGLFTNDRLVASSVERSINEARDAESTGSLEGLKRAEQILSSLAERHPERAAAQAAWAWQALVTGELLGPADVYIKKAKEALGRAGTANSAMGLAARAALAHAEGDDQGALSLAEQGIKDFPDEPRLHLARVWALAGKKQFAQAREAVDATRKKAPTYVPLLSAGLAVSLEQRDVEAARAIIEQLLTIEPGHLFASLASVRLLLPDWGEESPSEDVAETLAGQMAVLKPRIDSAPPKLTIMGRYLLGRVDLLTDRIEEAVESLRFAAAQSPDPDVTAWYAYAVQRLQGPAACLLALDERNVAQSPAALDVRARCLLDAHHLSQARDVVAKMAALDSLRESARRLEWTLAVRAGDAANALSKMPAVLGADDQWVALEAHDLFRARGDLEGTKVLVDRMRNGLPKCAVALQAWHGTNPELVVSLFTPERAADDACLSGLVARLMRRHLAPAAVKEAAKNASHAAGGNLSVEIDRAAATWLVDSRAAAVKILANVEAAGPDATPIRVKLARAYLEMGLSDRAGAVLAGVEDPDALAVRLLAAREAGKKADAAALLIKAQAGAKAGKSPALSYFALEAAFDAGAFKQVMEEADRLLPSAGEWTAEIAELKARALDSVGEGLEADRSLNGTARDVRAPVGMDESWETTVAFVRLNLRRGGAFVFKAVAAINELGAMGVKDPELSYSFAVINLRQGNERGAPRLLREALDVDPSFIPAYKQLKELDKVPDEVAARMKTVRPDLSL
ncbi:MAG: hypothetical protein PHU25_05085 [Deltaproteobacteria bacterium]|nr:hypothetical protein [Deltaproteobacteria bacterium]